MEKETYLAQGICTNCGRRNYPQWGTYEKGKKLSEYPCPHCKNMTWTTDYTVTAKKCCGENEACSNCPKLN